MPRATAFHFASSRIIQLFKKTNKRKKKEKKIIVNLVGALEQFKNRQSVPMIASSWTSILNNNIGEGKTHTVCAQMAYSPLYKICFLCCMCVR